MLRSVLGKEAAARVELSPFGKPFLPDGPCFNLSHSGDKVVLIIGRQEVGIDVELVTPYSWAVVQKVFTEAEQAWLSGQGTDEAFFRLWTGKEAIMKALGLGFRLPPESFEIAPNGETPCTVCSRNWHLFWFEADHHMICTASEYPTKPDRPIPLTRTELLQP